MNPLEDVESCESETTTNFKMSSFLLNGFFFLALKFSKADFWDYNQGGLHVDS